MAVQWFPCAVIVEGQTAVGSLVDDVFPLWDDTHQELPMMELTGADIQVLLESLSYSIQQVRDAKGTPYSVRRENLQRLEAFQQKLRAIRDQLA